MGGRAVLTFRWVVFVLALGFWIYMFHQMLDPTKGFGWQFRYLTIWALTASVASAGLCLRLSLGRGRRPDVLVSVTFVLNAMVCYLYWKLWLADPGNVTGDTPPDWWLNYYLHGLGPALQAVEALVILRAFTRPLATVGWLAAVVVAYVLWAELGVQPTNDTPVGTVTTGLPYPFLNDLAFGGRVRFYVTSALGSLIVVALGWGVTRYLLPPRSAASNAASPAR